MLERKLVTVEIIALEPDPGHLRPDFASRPGSFTAAASAASRTAAQSRSNLALAAASGREPRLAEVHLTVAPLLAGPAAGRVLTGEDGPGLPARLQLVQVLHDDGMLFLRLHHERHASPGPDPTP